MGTACFIFIGQIANFCRRRSRPIFDGSRGADKTAVLCKPRYQCGVNRTADFAVPETKENLMSRRDRSKHRDLSFLSSNRANNPVGPPRNKRIFNYSLEVPERTNRGLSRCTRDPTQNGNALKVQRKHKQDKCLGTGEEIRVTAELCRV